MVCAHVHTQPHTGTLSVQPCTSEHVGAGPRPRHRYTPAHTCVHLCDVRARSHTHVPCVQARSLQAVPRLVKLFNHANQEVQRHATGAMRNLIYDNADNKLALVEESGIFELLRTLREQDDELRKNVTGGPASPTAPRQRLSFPPPFCPFLCSRSPPLPSAPTAIPVAHLPS